jgi:hypothetical protein
LKFVLGKTQKLKRAVRSSALGVSIPSYSTTLLMQSFSLEFHMFRSPVWIFSGATYRLRGVITQPHGNARFPRGGIKEAFRTFGPSGDCMWDCMCLSFPCLADFLHFSEAFRSFRGHYRKNEERKAKMGKTDCFEPLIACLYPGLHSTQYGYLWHVPLTGDYIDKTKGKNSVGIQKAQKHRALHCATGRPGTKAHNRQTTGRAKKVNRSTAKKANKAGDTAKVKELRQSLHLKRTQHLRQTRHHSTAQHTRNRQPPETNSGTRSRGQHRSRLPMQQSQAAARRQLCISAAG